MTHFDRYLLRTIFFSILVTLLFLLGVDFLVQSADEADKVGNGQYSFAIMGYVLLLQFPQKMIEFTPAAILVGTIMGLGQMGAQNELTVVRTSGVSRLRLSFSGLFLALALGSGLVLIGEYVAPSANHYSNIVRSQALGNTSKTVYEQGVWVSDAKGIVHIGQLNRDGSISQLRFYRKEDQGGIAVEYADNAHFQPDGWALSGVRAFQINADSVRPHAGRTVWENRVTPQTLLTLANTESASTIAELISLHGFLKANGLNHSESSLRLWQRVFLPLTTLTMLLLALPFAYNTRRGSSGKYLVVGILLGVSYYVIEGIVAKICLLLNLPPILGAFMPIALFALPPLYFLSRD